jgi:hypothetical protein
MKETKISEDVRCDICKKEVAMFDGKTISGPWAYMCEVCYARNGKGLGLGKGQRLVKEKSNERT